MSSSGTPESTPSNGSRNINIQPQQAAALAQALRLEIEHAKAAGDDTVKAKAHHAKAASIRKILITYQLQQKAKLEQNSPVISPSGSPSISSAAEPVTNSTPPVSSDLSKSEVPPKPVTEDTPKTVITIDKLNKVKQSLDQLETSIAKLEEDKKNTNDISKVRFINAEIEKLKPNVANYQKLVNYFKTELLGRTSRTPSPTSPTGPRVMTRSHSSLIEKAIHPPPPPTPPAPTPPPVIQKPALSASNLSYMKTAPMLTPTSLANKISNISKLGGNIRPLSSSSLPSYGHTMGVPAMKLNYDNPNYTPNNIPDNGGRVLTKRKLADLAATIAATEGDAKPTVENDVEELLLDLADDFVSSVTTFACRLAKHRKVKKVDLRDFQIHLERNWNIRVPGFSSDDTRAARKLQPSTEYSQSLSNISTDEKR